MVVVFKKLLHGERQVPIKIESGNLLSLSYFSDINIDGFSGVTGSGSNSPLPCLGPRNSNVAQVLQFHLFFHVIFLLL